MQTGSARKQQASPPSSSPALERIEGRVESITDTGLRLSGRWYEWPRGWVGQRPAVGHLVRLHYRTRLVVQTIEPLSGSGNQVAAPKRPVGHPSSTLPSSAPSTLPSSAPSALSSSQTVPANGARRTEPGRSRAETSGSRTMVRGTIEAANDRGLKLHGIWYNFSRLTPIPDGVRQALVRGATVQLAVENQRWIAEAVIETAESADATVSAGSEAQAEDLQEGAYDESYL